MRSWIGAGLLGVAVLATVGCAGLSKVSMSSADRAQTKIITVQADDKMPEEMFYHGMGQSVAGAFGAVGAVVGASMAEDPKAQIIATMKSSNISLPSIVQAEFVKAMQAQNEFRLAGDGMAADAEMVLFINVYGLGQSTGFSGLYPLLNVSASLRKPDGTVIWQRTDYATPQNKENDEVHAFNDFIEQPEVLRGVWSKVAGIVSRMLVGELSPQR
jgi:hypothetical protein